MNLRVGRGLPGWAAVVLLVGLSACSGAPPAPGALPADGPRSPRPARSFAPAPATRTLVARTPTRPTLTEVRARVLDGANLHVAAETLRVAEARGRVRQAALPPNPYVIFRKRRIEDFEIFESGFSELEVGTPIELGGKRGARVAQAQAEVAQASEVLRALTLRTLRDAEAVFFRVLHVQDDLAYAREEVEATGELETLAQSRYAGGKDTRIASLRLEAQARDALLTVRDLEGRLEVACRDLEELLGVRSGSLEGVRGDWSLAALGRLDRETAQAALARHPRRLVAERAADVACRGVRRADAEAWPDLTVGVAAEHDDDKDRSYAGFVVGVPVPLFDRNQGTRAEARAAATRARRAVAAETLSLATELDAALVAYEKSAANAADYGQEILPRLEESLVLSRQAYEAGRASYLSVVDALLAWIRSRRARLTHLEGQARAATDVRYLTGAE